MLLSFSMTSRRPFCIFFPTSFWSRLAASLYDFPLPWCVFSRFPFFFFNFHNFKFSNFFSLRGVGCARKISHGTRTPFGIFSIFFFLLISFHVRVPNKPLESFAKKKQTMERRARTLISVWTSVANHRCWSVPTKCLSSSPPLLHILPHPRPPFEREKKKFRTCTVTFKWLVKTLSYLFFFFSLTAFKLKFKVPHIFNPCKIVFGNWKARGRKWLAIVDGREEMTMKRPSGKGVDIVSLRVQLTE